MLYALCVVWKPEMIEERPPIEWIQTEGPPGSDVFWMRARTRIAVPDDATSAAVRCASDGPYVLFINGRFVGRGPAQGDPGRYYVDSYDISPYLQSGANAVAARIRGPGGFRMEGEIVCRSGVRVALNTDESWRIQPADEWAEEEMYDARRAPDGWAGPEFDDSEWRTPRMKESPAVLVLRDIPMLRETERSVMRVAGMGRCASENVPGLPEHMRRENVLPSAPGDVREPGALLDRSSRSALLWTPRSGPDTYVLLDFGEEVVGFPCLSLEGGAGGIVDLGYGETQALDGIARAERYVMREGPQEWESPSRQAFRYMHLIFRGCRRRVGVNWVGVNTVAYPVDPRGQFSCSDERLNRIWRAGRGTLQLCMQDAYEDAALFPRMHRWGDIRIQALVNYYAFGEGALISRELRRFGRWMGEMPSPSEPNVTLGQEVPLLWILALWECYLHSGDWELLKTCYPAVAQTLGWFERGRTDDGLLDGMPEVSIDRMELGPRDRRVALSCFYYGALLAARDIAGALGDEAQADRWTEAAGILRRAFGRILGSEEKESRPFPPLVILLAVLFEAAGGETRFRLLSRSLRSEHIDRMDTPYFTFYLLDALYQAGQPNQAVGLIRDRWSKMIEEETTTCWEDFDGSGRRCYGASASPTYFLSAKILGAAPEAPGWSRARIEPRPSELAWAKGTVPSPRGDLRIAWSRGEDDQSFEIEVEVPEGVAAQIAIPRLQMKFPTIDLNGRTLWRNEKFRPTDLVREVAVDRAYVRFLVDRAGTYRFTACRG